METASNFNVGPIGYDPDQYKPLEEDQEPAYVVDVNINGQLFHVPCEMYDKNIQDGKTEFVTYGERVIMVTPEEKKQLIQALNYTRNVR